MTETGFWSASITPYPNVRRWSAVKLASVGARSYLEKLQFLRLYKGGKHRFFIIPPRTTCDGSDSGDTGSFLQKA
jgi:hypothetical protein